MTRRAGRARSGITLVEILISILIMGVGIISLATLFPLGLLRLRDAARFSRSKYMSESAGTDVEARNLFSKVAFLNLSTWYNISGVVYDPWVQDTPFGTASATVGGTPGGAFRGYGMDGSYNTGYLYNGNAISLTNGVFPYVGPGLPVAYDPVWWSIVGDVNGANPGIRPNNGTYEFRFGKVPWLAPVSGKTIPTSGLQRITNIIPPSYITPAPSATNWYYYNPDNDIKNTCISPDDPVWQTLPTQTSTGLSPLVPDLSVSGGQPTNDYHYSWMFTGQQTDSGTTFSGDLVIFENRQFGFDVNGNAEGETTVEAIFGYTKKVVLGSAGTNGYAPQPSYTILLRWQPTYKIGAQTIVMPDPEVKVGSWVADVTYERFAADDFTEQSSAINADPGNNNAVVPVYPSQRCYWYQVVKKSAPVPDPINPGTYRSMTVWVSTPLRAKTLLSSTGTPVYTNAAMISPNVVNVFPKILYAR